MKKLITLISAGLVLASCSNDTEEVVAAAPMAQNFNELVAPSSFNWSNSISANMEVQFDKNLHKDIELQGAEILILNSTGDRIAREIIKSNKAEFNISLPASASGYQFHLPATGEFWPLEVSEKVSLSLSDPFDLESAAFSKRALGKNRMKQANMSGINAFANSDFETTILNSNIAVGNTFMPYHSGLNNQWKTYTNKFTQTNVNGTLGFKATGNNWFWQNHSVSAGDSIFINAETGGSSFSYVYVFFFANQNSSSWLSYQRVDLNSFPEGVATIVPNGATVATGLFYLGNGQWVDNAFYSNSPAVTDADGDGVSDDQDDFPNDPSKAYLSYYPNSGRQTIAFEDMWPIRGDYDFNDVIVNSKMTLVKNAANEWVSAEVELALDAFGGGIENGLAIQLVNGSKAAMSSMNISVSGDASLDPNVNNGIIVFSDPDEKRSSYYTNTEAGLMATPDTVRFTINFGSNNGTSFIPDFYIFQTEDRGVEVHLPGFSGTSQADASLYNTGDDVNGSYQTVTGLPWGMELVLPEGTSFKHPYEKIDMISAYPQFSAWATSGGASNSDWYLTGILGNLVDLGL